MAIRVRYILVMYRNSVFFTIDSITNSCHLSNSRPRVFLEFFFISQINMNYLHNLYVGFLNFAMHRYNMFLYIGFLNAILETICAYVVDNTYDII